MTTTGDLRIDDWVVHRPNVVRSVAARVPGIDAEEAASRALEKMVRLVSTGTTIDDPAPYWRRAAVNEAISMTREAGRTRPVEDDTLDGLAPPVAGAELDAERQADVSMLRSALSDLGDDDRQILLERHVHDKAVTDIASGLGVRPHAVTMRLRRAEERLAGAFAAAHAQGVNEPECRTTRAAMHDYLKGRLLPRRQRRLEVHMDGCAECTRAFIDVREVSWMLRDLGQHLIAGGLVTGAAGAGVVGTAAVGTGTTGTGTAGAGAKSRSFGKKETAVAAGVLAALAIGGGAMALIANQSEPPVQAIQDTGTAPGGDGAGGGSGSGGGGAGGGGAGGGGGSGAGDGSSDDAPSSPDQAAQDQPPSIPPADPQPRPATTPKEDAAPAANPVVPSGQDGADPAPAPAPEPDDAPPAAAPGPGPDPDPAPDGGADEPDPVPPTAPAPEEPAGPPPSPPEPPDPPVAPGTPGTPASPVSTAVEDLLASLGLADLPGIDLATTTLDEIWRLLFGTAADSAGQAVDDAQSAAGG
ncbi:RNA polymerase sigma factor [Promicromonospora vindobonensis]|uniref:RNA polymerase sigma factor n=1 Tax=Promicromonospora vindobonensis TaxID=195748 RepID=A0ABW5VR23_9MICO